MIEIKKTEDGSHTVFVPTLNEHYHSAFGAIQESMHVFIGSGLHECREMQELSVLEMGFGTGLNALLTALNMTQKKILYRGIEAYPLKPQVTARLNYPELLSDSSAECVFKQLHEASWGVETLINGNFLLTKIQRTIQDVALPHNAFDLVYYDAFAPDVQPELWAHGIFNKIHRAMKPGGILVTYSAKGLVKQNLRGAGFTVKRLPGPPGKKHMIRAMKGFGS